MGHARALLPLEKVEQIKLAEEIIKKALSVRQVEALVERIKKQKEEPETPSEEGEILRKTAREALRNSG